MNEQQAQALAQRMRAHLPHVEVEVQKSSDFQDWIDAAYPRDPEFPRLVHDDDGTWACRVVIPGEDVTRASTRIARIYFDERDWESYVNMYEPLIHRFLTHHRKEMYKMHLLPTLLGIALLLFSTFGLIAAFRLRQSHRKQHEAMTPEQVKDIQASYHTDANQMVRDLNARLEPEGKHVPERFVFNILDIDPKAVYDQQEEGQPDVSHE